jgi:acyl-CoA dehydrogenase
MAYRAPVPQIVAQLAALGYGRLAAVPRFADAGLETARAVLEQAARLAENVLAPLNRTGDADPARLENGVVRTPPGFPEAYRAIADGGWVGIAGDPAHGGMGLPGTLAACVNEMFAGACLALQTCPLLTHSQIEALEVHGSEALKATYLPMLVSGKWTGTMNLTEPQAGSDVGAIRTRAEPAGDGTYRITGQKIYITWGDHDMAENVVHAVLARLPDGAAGTRGISLFLVPKRIPDGGGRPGAANRLRPVSLEHKLGLRGSPTTVMEYDGATGWLVGPPHGGMATMFTMMNSARLSVGVQGVGVAEAATQAALAFARERVQGRTVTGAPTIIGHPDVRRMLTTMRALTAAARAICLDCAMALDLAAATGEARHDARAAFLTPIAKAFGTDVGREVADLAIQVHGGMGYIEETGVAQLWRDVRVTAIYEGTNGIQAADLVLRKLADGAAAAAVILDEIDATAAADADLGPALAAAARRLREATEWMAGAPAADRLAGSAPFLRAFALVLGARHLIAAAGNGTARGLARFHVRQLLPAASGLLAAALEGDAALAMPEGAP